MNVRTEQQRTASRLGNLVSRNHVAAGRQHDDKHALSQRLDVGVIAT